MTEKMVFGERSKEGEDLTLWEMAKLLTMAAPRNGGISPERLESILKAMSTEDEQFSSRYGFVIDFKGEGMSSERLKGIVKTLCRSFGGAYLRPGTINGVPVLKV